jgi:hypothetical protein
MRGCVVVGDLRCVVVGDLRGGDLASMTRTAFLALHPAQRTAINSAKQRDQPNDDGLPVVEHIEPCCESPRRLGDLDL